MPTPGISREEPEELALSCGSTLRTEALDLGMRETDCSCGNSHAVVMDVHPLSRWIPETVEAILDETIETSDDYPSFSTIHLMGLVLEEYPDQVVAQDVSEEDALGAAVVWVTEFDSRRLHELIVELLLELMEHAMTHTEDSDGRAEFEEQLFAFDIEAFVDQYRSERGFSGPTDRPV